VLDGGELDLRGLGGLRWWGGVGWLLGPCEGSLGGQWRWAGLGCLGGGGGWRLGSDDLGGEGGRQLGSSDLAKEERL
jgi:hypothetical protein